MTFPLKHFACDSEGYVRHWIIVGPRREPYRGPAGSEDAMRRAMAGPAILPPPSDAALGAPGPFGEHWRFYAPGANVFVECSSFYSTLDALDLYAVTDLLAPADAPLPARFWACGTADLWLNGEHVLRHDVPRYMYPNAVLVTLPLRRGANRLAVRLQALGVRDTRMLFGLQALEAARDLAVRLPGDPAACDRLVEAEAWLQSVRAAGRDRLASAHPAPLDAVVTLERGSTAWPAGAREVAIEPSAAFTLAVAADVAGQRLERRLEIPANRPAPAPAKSSLEEHRHEQLRLLAAVRPGQVFHLLARRLLGDSAEEDSVVAPTLKGIDERRDCSDFTLAALLRLVALGLARPAEAEAIRRTALAFRYWDDEPGNDAMCFGSENHSLLFHGCQLLAGQLYPAERFANSGRTGAEQAALGAARCRAWLDEVERVGFREYLSTTYMPLSVAALMNVADFAGDAALSQRAAALADRVVRDLARHAFDSVVVGPQGRVYRNVLYPQTSGTQALLSYATTDAAVASTPWIVFVASSRFSRPPDGLGALMREPLTTTYRQNGVEIHLRKTPDFLLTSLEIPASFDRGQPPNDDEPNWRSHLWPGLPGYQQHLWQATLGRDCHVFVNHPDATFDLSSSRPGYWYGNGSLPRMALRGDLVLQAFDIPEDHPVGFTHAHWPSDAFRREEVTGHWAFGWQGTGAVALWCSAELSRCDEMLTGRELRAQGRRVAWLCRCGRATNAASFESFVRSSVALDPTFDRAARRLTLRGTDGLDWTN